MKIGNREFDVKNKTYIMGILNVTPDSFSDGGKWNDMETKSSVRSLVVCGAASADGRKSYSSSHSMPKSSIWK